jgi:hypothetical protein
MEHLTEKVYECTLAVEAHMVCDLLSQAGISARVDGEFLQGAGGELPLGNLVKVRVDPARAAEAREVNAEWEQQQPEEPASAPLQRSSRVRSPLWFMAGLVVGAMLVAFAFRNARGDYDDFDRNHDGRIDARWIFDFSGAANRYEQDDDFDGRFEWQMEADDGVFTRAVLDADFDGRPEQVAHYVNGVLASTDFYHGSGGRIVKRQFFEAGVLASAEFDDDGDGVFERRVEYDAHAEPRL